MKAFERRHKPRAGGKQEEEKHNQIDKGQSKQRYKTAKIESENIQI